MFFCAFFFVQAILLDFLSQQECTVVTSSPSQALQPKEMRASGYEIADAPTTLSEADFKILIAHAWIPILSFSFPT